MQGIATKKFSSNIISPSTMNLYCIVLICCMVSSVYTSEGTSKSLKQRMTLLFKPVSKEETIACSSGRQGFRKAVREGNMNIAFDVFNNGSDELKKYCGKYLINQGSTKLVELINGAARHINDWMLQLILVHADQRLVDQIFDALNFPNEVSSRVARNVELACMPQKFIHLLTKIGDKREQERAVIRGVAALLQNNRIDCLDSLLVTLRKGAFPNQDLENVAIRAVFAGAFRLDYDGTFLAKRFFDHPVVSVKDYSKPCMILTDWVIGEAKHFVGCWREQIVKTWKQS